MAKTIQAVAEPVYSKAELISAAVPAFNTVPEVVQAALEVEGVTEATRTQAAEIINKFLTREVK